MSIFSSPSMVSEGLVLCLDAANRDSYPGTGTVWTDLSGNGNNGTLTNGPTFSSGNGGGIVFDGTNDYMNTGNIDLSGTNVISVDFWCNILTYVETINSAKIIFELSTNFNGITTGFIAAYADDSNPVFGGLFPITISVKGNSVTQSGYNISYWPKTLVNDLKWHHWCCIFDKSQSVSETFLYIDSIYRTGTLTAYNANNTNNFGSLPFYIGGRGATINSNIQISNLKLYNRALTAGEVLQNYKATRKRFGL